MTEDRKMPDRAETARENDDSDLIEGAEPGPSHGGTTGGNLQRDIGSRDELGRTVEGDEGITRVRDSDKPEEADLPRYNQR